MTPLDTLRELREDYPTPMSSDQLGQLLNEVAWIHRADGYGVLLKTTGSHCLQPGTGRRISKDIIALTSDIIEDGRPKCRIFDCLIDAEGAAKPTWNDKGTSAASKWTAPVDPAALPEPPGPEPPVPPPSQAVIPYNESYSLQFGQGCNDVYRESGATVDPGMISVHSQRCAYDYYTGGLPWDDSYRKHLNEFRAEYGLLPLP